MQEGTDIFPASPTLILCCDHCMLQRAGRGCWWLKHCSLCTGFSSHWFKAQALISPPAPKTGDVAFCKTLHCGFFSPFPFTSLFFIFCFHRMMASSWPVLCQCPKGYRRSIVEASECATKKKKKPHRKNCPDKDGLSAAYNPCLNATTTRESL